jgi:ribonuclease P protein subunit RPR2
VARRNKGEERGVALDRVARLADLAAEALRAGRRDRADRYAQLAWRVKTRYQLRGTAIDARICRACKAYLAPGVSSRVRLRGGRRVTTCLACGASRRKVLSSGPASAPRGQPDQP